METYRGWVTPWECDIIEHLTIAYVDPAGAAAGGPHRRHRLVR